MVCFVRVLREYSSLSMIIGLDDLSRELCEMCVCALCGGQRGGSGSQLVVGIITEKTIALDIIIIASRTLLKIGRAASVLSGRNTLWV